MNVRSYHASDADQLVARPGDRYVSLHGALVQHSSFVRTIEVDGVPVAILGLVVRWRGVADIWALISDDARGHGLALTRTARALLEQFADELQLWRVSATVHEDRHEYHRWIRLLGLDVEGVEYNAAPDGRHLWRYMRRWEHHLARTLQ